MNDLGVIAIGRNEGERLRRCLASVVGQPNCRMIYVDSNSTDGSVEMTLRMGVEVVELDMSLPFSAARARNAGFERLMQVAPQTTFVQFIDGDCEVDSKWLDIARAELERRPELAVTCGRRRERHPEKTVYNRLTDIEWNTPIGDAKSCGGDSMMRVEAFKQVGGYNPAVIAGEEPEMCVRLRQKGWKISRIDAEMTLHDADMTRFGQFWKRMIRGGHAYAEGAWMHGRPPERHGVGELRKIVLWGMLAPAVIALLLALIPLFWPSWILVAAVALLYPLQVVKISLRDGARRNLPMRDAWTYGFFVVACRFPQAIGAITFWSGKLRGKRSAIIEYKSAEAPAPAVAPFPRQTDVSAR